jgi:exosortase
MQAIPTRKTVDVLLWGFLGVLLLLQYDAFIKTLVHTWLNDAEFSYGIIIPVIVAYLIWSRRYQLQGAVKTAWPTGLAIGSVGCGLQVLASVSGSLIVSGLALAISLIGVVGFLWGRQCLRIVAMPLGFLILSVPMPSYLLGQLTWHLQVMASTISATLLDFVGVPVYQDGNLLRLPDYSLEVKEACSGSRSIFALLAIALVLGISLERKWRIRIALVAAVPALAITANVIRIVGTGLIALRFGSVARNESLHTAWGIVAFILAVTGLLGFQRLLRWVMNGRV